MALKQTINGLQHIGIPTRKMDVTLEFYSRLGFTPALRTKNPQTGERVFFLTMCGLCLEVYESADASERTGAIAHFALDVTDAAAAYEQMKREGYTILSQELRFLPFWENGIRFFTVQGPNGEKVEFCQKL